MSEIPHDPLDASVETVGPFSEHHELTVGGYQVPYISIQPLSDGNLDLSVDNRFCATFTPDELKKFGWILAQAMAVAAGYSCHGHGSRPINPFGLRMTGISTTTTELPEDDAEQAQ